MPIKSEVIYSGAHYTASAMRDGSLIIERRKALKNGNRGVVVPAHEAAIWIEHIRTADDAQEAHAYCRALIAA